MIYRIYTRQVLCKKLVAFTRTTSENALPENNDDQKHYGSVPRKDPLE